jgi:hypothetical protein
MPVFSRKQNTNNYHQRIERVITGGEEILEEIKVDTNSWERIKALFTQTSQWLEEGRAEVARIYNDAAVYEALPNEIPANLDDDSHADIIDALNSIIEERIGALDEIRRQTREHDAAGISN